MKRPGSSPMRLAIGAAVAIAMGGGLFPPAVAARTTEHPFASPGIKGTGGATMEAVLLPARVARVVVVPGTGGREAWAAGLSTSPAYPGSATGGQVVFLHYTRGAGWRLVGPPVDAAGRPLNRTLYSFDVVAGGAGFAVGERGTIIRRRAGGAWVQDPQSGSVTQSTLRSVDVVSGAGEAMIAYAVGDGPTILRFDGARWTNETPPTVLQGLVAVSATSATNAWAVGGTEDLALYQRQGSSWSLRSTNTLFDGPHPQVTPAGTVVRAVRPASIMATSAGVWIGGGIAAVDPTSPFTDPETGSQTRPFALRVAGSALRSWCPDIYSLADGPTEADKICDEPFPQSGFDLTSFSALSNGEVFAGGLGLFHFRKEAWVREPDALGYLVSVSFASVSEGWVASSGNTFGGAGAVYSSVPAVGHFTVRPQKPKAARWPQPNSEPLDAVAVDPVSGENAIAAGQSGALLEYSPFGGWDRVNEMTSRAYHAIAWPEPGRVFAVGQRGTIARRIGQTWSSDPASESLTTLSLFGIAFRGRTGIAVGQQGIILRYDGVRWRLDEPPGRVTTKTLYGVVATPAGFLAVGEGATVLEESAGTWRAVPGVAPLVTRSGQAVPTLYAAAEMPDGGVVVGGQNGALAWRPAGGAFRRHAGKVEGTITTLAATSGAPEPSLIAGVSLEESKYAADRYGTAQSFLMSVGTDGARDLTFAYKRSIYDSNDPSQPADAIMGVAMAKDGKRGWAVGGMPPSTPDAEGHALFAPTSGIYRIDLDGDPEPLEDLVPPEPEDGVTFAVFAESICGKGLCSATVGTGTRADVVPVRIREQIEFLSRRPGGPEFVLFGGNARGRGLPEELGQFNSFLKTFPVPVFGAVGDRDLTRVGGNNVIEEPTGRTDSFTASTVSNLFYRKAFASMPGPWGTAAERSRFKPVGGGAAPNPGEARTHYAFDVIERGTRSIAPVTALRVIVLDSSAKSLSGSEQNPNEDQNDWFNRVRAQSQQNGVPTVVLMNQPTLNPQYASNASSTGNWPLSEATAFHQQIAQSGVSAVFTGGFPGMTTYRPAIGGVPFYVSGGGGRPSELTRLPTSGYYNGWLLVTVRKPPGRPTQVDVKSMPVLDSTALDAFDGTYVRAGNVLRFAAVSRMPDGGFSDPEQSKGLYMRLPFAPRCNEGGPGSSTGGCVSQTALLPQFEFSTADPERARFVAWDSGGNLPARDPQDNSVPSDPLSGYLCTFKAGPTTVYVTVGMHRAAYPIYIDGGFGPCVDKPVKPEDPPRPPPPPPPPPPSQPEPRPFFFFGGIENQSSLFPPIPAPVVAPAPPGAPGVGRKEEHEVQTETEGHGENQSFTALQHRGTVALAQEQSWAMLAALAMMAFMGACAASAVRERLRIGEERVPNA